MGETPDEFASPADVEQAIRGLRDEDWLRLEKAASYHVYRYSSINPKEVLAEAVSRMLGGERRWPRDVNFNTYFRNVLRSVADELRNKEKERLGLGTTVLVAFDDGQDGPPDGRDLVQQVEHQETIEQIWGLFSDDEQVQSLVLGAEEGMTAIEVQKEFNLSGAEYDAARKRLDRGLKKHFPKGWRS